MKGKIILITFILGLWFSIPFQAREYKVEDIPMVHLQDRTRYVSNPDGVLSNEAVRTMDHILYTLEQETGIQTLVVAVNEIEGGDCFEFAHQLGVKNGVGQKGHDNGLVILLVTGERCIQFSTGYGLEGALPDAVCKQIQIRYMNPYLGKGNWNEGMLNGIKAISMQLDKNAERHPVKQSPQTDNGTNFPVIIIVVLFLLFPIFIWFYEKRKRRCPRCHKNTLRVISTRTIRKDAHSHTEEIVYLCSNCGHTKTVLRRINDDDMNNHHRGNGPLRGGFFIGGFGGRGGGGGFSGGSFGGGDFGGGGAGSRF